MSDLQEIADRVVSMAQPGEHIEAFVSRDSETDIRIYEGEVEHFVAAQTEGVGIRVIRDGIVVYSGNLGSLKRFKDDVKEVLSGYECGLNIESFNDLKIGDIIEGYEQTEVKRKL